MDIKIYNNVFFEADYECSIEISLRRTGRPAVKWLGKPVAEPKIPGSNPGQGMDVELSVPWPHQWLRSKTGRREVPGSFFGRACRPSRSEFSVVFSETRVNTG